MTAAGLARRRRRRQVVLLFIALLLVTQLVWWTEPLPLFGLLESAAPNIVWRVHTNRPLVALSFDDGPHPVFTPQVLAILERHGAHATFFVIGERARAHPDLVQAIRDAGHELGNHYYRRGTALTDNQADFTNYLDRGEHAIGRFDGPKLFRPPGGLAWPWQLQAAHERGYINVLGSAYPHDPARPPVAYIRWLIEKNMVPGAIVILHDGISDPSRSIQALPDVLAAGERRGFQFVSVGELLRER